MNHSHTTVKRQEHNQPQGFLLWAFHYSCWTVSSLFWHCRIKHVHHRSMLLDLESKCVNLHLFNIIFPKSRIIVFIKVVYFADVDNFFQLHSRCAARITFNYKILREINTLKSMCTRKSDIVGMMLC